MIEPKETHSSNECGDYEILSNEKWDCIIIKFIETGTILKTRCDKIKNGNIRDKMHPDLFGVGFIGYGKHTTNKTRLDKIKYSRWSHMIRRCNSKVYQDKNKTYKGCSVCKEWHNYQNFGDWFDVNYVDDGNDYQLDKDIKIPGNKIYSPETCMFVTVKENVDKANEWKMKPITVRNVNTGDVITVLNQREFCKNLNINNKNFNAMTRGKRKTCMGFVLA